jgi:cytochrome P450
VNDIPLHMRRDHLDPAAELRERAGTGRVARTETLFGPAWLVGRHSDVREVLGDADRFANGGGNRLAISRDGFLLGYDPPEHTRLRKMLTPEFTVRRMRRIEPRVEEIITSHLDAMEQAGPPADLVEAFALPVPSLVICELLGVPYGDRDRFQRLSRQLLDLSLPFDERAEADAGLGTYMSGLVERQLADPGDDMIGMLVREHGDGLTRRELVGIARLLLVAGHETTSNMFGTGTLLLLEHPDQLALVRDDPALTDRAVEELMRYLTVVPAAIMRTATADTTLAGQPIRAGDRVVASLPLANRDGALLDGGDRLDVTRAPGPHVAFGHGVHHCLGAPLARMEMRIGFPALLRRFPGLRLAVPAEEVEFRPFAPVYGLRSLPVEW